ncbi:MAG: SRPBCC family protein [Dermatophilaceae bacterium]
MPKAERTIVIGAPLDQVFAFFTDPENDSKWRRHIKEIAANTPADVGSTIHLVVAGPGGRSIPADLEVVAYEPSTRYAFQVTAGPVRPAGEFLFASSGSGTEVRFSLHVELRGIKKLAMSKPVQKSMDGEMASLDEAKVLLEHS